MRSKNSIYLWTVMVIATAGLLPTPVLAYDYFTYHGSFCEPDGLSNDEGISKGLTGISNVSGSRQMRTVVCPIIRDQTAETRGIPYVYVRVRTRHVYDTRALSCTLRSREADGDALPPLDSRATSSVTQDGYHEMMLGNSNSTASGYADIVCELPYRASIAGYMVLEY